MVAVKHRALIENVQRRATKFILIYPQNMTYNERLIKFNLLPLEHRREISDLLLFFRSRNGLISTEVSNYLRTFQPRHRTRNYDPNNYYVLVVIKDQIVRCLRHLAALHKSCYYINTNEIPGELSRENISSHVKITCYLHT